MQKRLFVIVQDSALPINSNEVIHFLDESLKIDIQFSRVPLNMDGRMLTNILGELFTEIRKENPEIHILLMTSSQIYGPDFTGNYGPDEVADWLKKNFTNSSYAVRSLSRYTKSGNIDFCFEKEPLLDKGIAKNITEVYNTVFRKS